MIIMEVKKNCIEEFGQMVFTGFLSVDSLKESLTLRQVPDVSGVYLVLRISDVAPVFLESGTGGFFKGKDPNVPIEELKANWVDGTNVLYVGKATSLRKRLGQYIRFGQGKPVGHWGGRYIWQLSDSENLILCWKTVNASEDPDVFETELINRFRSIYGCRPFANLTK